MENNNNENGIFTIIWIGLAAIFVTSFIALLPIQYYEEMMCTFLTSLIATLFILFGLLKIRNWKQLSEILGSLDLTSQEIKFRVAGLAVLLGIITLGIKLALDYRVDQALLKDGVLNYITMTGDDDKNGDNSYDNGGECFVYWTDTISTGEGQIIKRKIPCHLFYRLEKGSIVDYIYLPKYPEISKMLVTDEDIRKYMKIEHRDLNFEDINNLLDIICFSSDDFWNIEGAFSYIDSISAGWYRDFEDTTLIVLKNTLREEQITMDNYVLLYEKYGRHDVDLTNFIPKDSIQSIDSISEGREIITLKNQLFLFQEDKQVPRFYLTSYNIENFEAYLDSIK